MTPLICLDSFLGFATPWQTRKISMENRKAWKCRLNAAYCISSKLITWCHTAGTIHDLIDGRLGGTINDLFAGLLHQAFECMLSIRRNWLSWFISWLLIQFLAPSLLPTCYNYSCSIQLQTKRKSAKNRHAWKCLWCSPESFFCWIIGLRVFESLASNFRLALIIANNQFNTELSQDICFVCHIWFTSVKVQHK